MNGLKLAKKQISDKIGGVRRRCRGLGLSRSSCQTGSKKRNIWVTDIAGVIYEGRTEEINDYNIRYAQKTEARALDDVISDADVFLGVSAPGVLRQEMVKKWQTGRLF